MAKDEGEEVFDGYMGVATTIVEKNPKGTVYKVKGKRVSGNPGEPGYLKVSVSVETGDFDLFQHMPRNSALATSVYATQQTLEDVAEGDKASTQTRLPT